MVKKFEIDDESIVEALKQIISAADETNDGHVTIMKFTTGWKILFDSPPLFRADESVYWGVSGLPGFMSFEDAAEYALKYRPSFLGLQGFSTKLKK